MNVFGHDHVSRDVKSIPLPRLLESLLEDVAGVRRAKKGSASKAAKRHKVQAASLLKALETPRHVSIVTPEPGPRRPQPLIFFIVLPHLGKSKSPPCRRKRDKDGAPAEMRERARASGGLGVNRTFFERNIHLVADDGQGLADGAGEIRGQTGRSPVLRRLATGQKY